MRIKVFLRSVMRSRTKTTKTVCPPQVTMYVYVFMAWLLYLVWSNLMPHTFHWQASIFSCPGFDAHSHIGPDGMHTIAGIIKDTFLGCFQSTRYSDKVALYEHQTNNRFEGVRPWEAPTEDQRQFKKALVRLAEASDSRMLGRRFTTLLDKGHKNKSHAMFVLAGPYGECRGPGDSAGHG